MGIAVDGTHVYWTDHGLSGTQLGSIMRVALDGGTPTVLATSQAEPRADRRVSIGSTTVHRARQ